jgi:hypothetical protein
MSHRYRNISGSSKVRRISSTSVTRGCGCKDQEHSGCGRDNGAGSVSHMPPRDSESGPSFLLVKLSCNSKVYAASGHGIALSFHRGWWLG